VWRDRIAAWWKRLDPCERAAVLVWVALLLALCTRGALRPTHPDLYLLWENAGKAWSRGGDLYNWQRGDVLVGFRYGPLMAACLSPLQLVDVRTGNVLWRLANALPFLAAVAWWLRAAAPAMSGRQRGLLWLWLAPLMVPSLHTGQPNVILIACILACLAAAAQGRWNLAALAIAVASIIKVYPLAVALLLVAAYPRKFAWRLLAALVVLAAIPLFLQSPAYTVRQYGLWWDLLSANDSHRRFLPFDAHDVYRDMLLVLRLFNVPITATLYVALQLLAAAVSALLVVAARRRGASDRDTLLHVLVLGTIWMTLWGPATEGRTYVILAPALVWWLLETHRRTSTAARSLVVVAAGFQVLCLVSTISPYGPRFYHAGGLHPLSAVLLSFSYLLAGWPRAAALSAASPEATPVPPAARAA
jgi:hypothetical protein